jgi:hypothetical protein
LFSEIATHSLAAGTQVLLIWNAISMISELNFGAMPRNKMVACGTRNAMVYQF